MAGFDTRLECEKGNVCGKPAWADPDVELRDLADFNDDVPVEASSDDEVYPWTVEAAADIEDSLFSPLEPGGIPS
jgi:hypothetical protein